MAAKRGILESLAALLPLGALGISTALAAVPGKTELHNSSDAAAPRSVAIRLGAIRNAVSKTTAEQAGLVPGDPRIQKAWWANWHPGGGGWRNGGWGWRNGGWGNGGWPNWHNGWHNGGWHNFWRNW
jgi:rSAM-associated Gly-rich repeat protein